MGFAEEYQIERLKKENKSLRETLKIAYQALSFYKSAIKSGEEWSEECEKIYNLVLQFSPDTNL